MARKTKIVQYTNENKINKINTKNKKIVKQFLQDKSRKVSPDTIKNYQSDLNIFFCYIMENCDNVYFPDIQPIDYSSFFSFGVDDLGWGSSRFARMRSVLSSFSDFFETFFYEQYPTFRNRINKIIEPLPNEAVRKKTILSDEDLQLVLDYLKDKNPTYAFVVALAAYSGCRIRELIQFDIDSLDNKRLFLSDIFYETTNKIRCKGHGKNGLQINKYVIKKLIDPYLERYLQYRQTIVDKTHTQNNALILKENGEAAQVSSLNAWRVIWEKDLEKKYNKKFHLYFHNYRHYFTTKLSRMGLSKDIIMLIVGWKSDMVEVYNDVSAKERNWDKDIAKLKNGLDI